MPIVLGTGAGQYPPVVQYLANGEPADDITFNRPLADLDKRTEAVRNHLAALAIADVAGLTVALGGGTGLHQNLRDITLLDYSLNPGKIFAVSAGGTVELISNTLQGENNTGANVGTGAGNVFQTKAGVELRFRTFKAGTNMTINQSADEIELVAAPGEIKRITKRYKNTTGAPIPLDRAVAFLDDGTIALADANIMTLSDFCGITAEVIPDGAFGLVGKMGNMPGCLAGLGALPGRKIYLSGTPGILTLTPPAGLTDSILVLGYAEPPDGVLSGSADDLFLQPAYYVEGGV